MSQLPTYSFLPWLRHGVANTITSADVEAGGAALRATVEVKLNLNKEPLAGGAVETQVVPKTVSLYGPGDVVGIDPKAIVKVEPRHWITNFEPNYLPYIEFYEEDFPWRYTPAAPGAHHRLRPWIMLVVLKEDEFENGKNILNKPLPFINVLKQSTLPAPDDLWAWAHVHVNRSLNGTNPDLTESFDAGAIANNLKNLLAQNPDLASSRILCPRELAENTTYHAFLVPVFESGRLAGLGQDLPAGLTATKSAWGTTDAAVELPVYHRWQFSTGTIGDFEYLVRLLKPVTANPKVGRRDLAAQLPGANLPPWQEAPGLPDDQKTEGIFKLGGALRAPLSLADFNLIKKYELWSEVAAPNPHPFQEKMAALLNLEDDYKALEPQQANQDSGLFENPDPADPEDLDPVITPPIYGRWHAKVQRLLKDRDGSDLPNPQNWIHEMNLDPRFRAANGFGTKVVQENQEDYMFAAWKQIGEVLKGNQVIKQGQVSLSTSLRWYTRHVEVMPKVQPQQFFFFTAPMHRRVISEGVTILHEMKTSVVPPAVVSAPMRRIIRPRGRFVKKLQFGPGPVQSTATLLERLNKGEIFAAPPKKAGESTPVISKVVDPVGGVSTLPVWLKDLLRRYPFLKWAILILAIILALVGLVVVRPFLFALFVAAAILGAGYYLFLRISEWEKLLDQETISTLEDVTPELVEEIPKRPGFELTPPGSPFRPVTVGTADSEEGKLFRESILDWAFFAQESEEAAKTPPKTRLDFPALQTVILDKIHPQQTIPSRVLGTLQLPGWLIAQLVETFDPVMAYPKLDLPMYKPLEKVSSELFLPNIKLIENNTISLLKTNQKFIESYMVGLNHEFARELLWREYPTDQRGSSFRQFWDVSTVLKPVKFPAPEKENELEWRDKLYDIPEVHTWSKTSKLGKHDHRELPGQPQEEEVVLAVRGELLKKYPTAVIYAHKAEWATKADGTIDKAKIRKLMDLTAADEADLEDGQVAAGNKKVQTPLYSAKVDPDIYFFGFNLTVEEVQGAKGDEPDAASRPGWFFVIKERPGEPRFGLDIDKAATINGWNDLSWKDVKVVNGTLDVGGSAPVVPLVAPTKLPGEEQEIFDTRLAQHNEDKNMAWSDSTNAAELAYILYQVPVLVAVHGAEMLPGDLAPGDF